MPQRRDDLGGAVRSRRRLLGLTLRELARRSDLNSPSFVLYIENGSRIPSPEVARRLALALGEDPEHFEAWAHLLGRTSPERALASARRILARTDEPDQGVPTISLASVDPAPASLRVPLIPSGADPGMSLRLDCPVLETLRIPAVSLPPIETLPLPFAYPLAGELIERVPDLARRGRLGLLVRDGAAPAPGALHAVRLLSGIRLARVMWNGRQLLLLPAPGRDDFAVLDADDRFSLAALLVGRVVRMIADAPLPATGA